MHDGIEDYDLGESLVKLELSRQYDLKDSHYLMKFEKNDLRWIVIVTWAWSNNSKERMASKAAIGFFSQFNSLKVLAVHVDQHPYDYIAFHHLD